MGLINLTRTSATVANGGSYQPNCLLSGAFALTLQGSATILPPVAIGDGSIIAIRLNFAANPAAVVTFDPAYLMGGEQVLTGNTGGSMCWFFGYEEGFVLPLNGFGF